MVVKHLSLLQTEKESVTKRKQKDIKSRTSFYELTPRKKARKEEKNEKNAKMHRWLHA